MRAEPRALRRRRRGVKYSTVSTISSSVSTRITPTVSATASKQCERAGERAGMRERRLAALLRAADLDRDDRLAGVARVFAGARGTSPALLDRLDEAGDRPDVGIVGEIADVVRQSLRPISLPLVTA